MARAIDFLVESRSKKRSNVVFNESQFMSFKKEPSKEIECVPCSFPQEENHEDSEGKLELRRSTRNRAALDRFGEQQKSSYQAQETAPAKNNNPIDEHFPVKLDSPPANGRKS
ncbi:hypothetical protein FHG87_004842 [Trinorchestia longiramus]|nr:hypothetical protein FHG87_004842 [Trinorchestia longiramus]